MQYAVDQLTTGAPDEIVKGIFVPSSDAYVSRKMQRKPAGTDRTVLSEKLRFDMLQSFHEKGHRLGVDGRELRTTAVKGHTIETLLSIQRGNPESQIYFIFGGDKLEGLARWSSYESLVSNFKVIIFGRDGLVPQRIIQKNQALAAHADSFLILQAPEGLDGISSTAVREYMRREERMDNLLTYEVNSMLLEEMKKAGIP
ncbi:MAG: hypothetical protein IJ646_09055 [Clostridia bacterium]|nr:hypothetical protein [Clostridia bacterium]